MKKHLRSSTGFTLIELLVAVGIFVTAMILISVTSVHLYRGYKSQMAQNTLYEESRVLMDRVVREVRVNTIDYDEYFNHLDTADGGPVTPAQDGESGEYGLYYRQYYHYFFFVSPAISDTSCGGLGLNDPERYTKSSNDPCKAQHTNEGYFSTKANNSKTDDNRDFNALGIDVNDSNADKYEKDELYLISPDGMNKTIVRLNTSGQVEIYTLDIQDSDADDFYDSWAPNADFPDGFIPISPPSILVTDLRFFLSPVDDPRKEYNSAEPEVQSHPNVTIVMTAEVAPDVARVFRTTGVNVPEITLQTTVSSRVYSNVLIPFEVSE